MTPPEAVKSDEGKFSVSFSYPTDQYLIGLILGSRKSITFVEPGMAVGLATAIAEASLQQQGVDMAITVDLEPEVCRLGFGELAAVEICQGIVGRKCGILKLQSGLRLCALTVDDANVVFPPVPRLVESPPDVRSAICVSIPLPPSECASIGEQLHGSVPSVAASTENIADLKQDLLENPPLPFDLSQKVHVFNAQFEFVEFELKGLALSRKKVPVPFLLMRLSKDPKAQNLLQSSFRLIGDNTELSADVVLKLKKRLIEQYLISLPNYGNVILRAKKPRFERSVRLLKHYIVRYQKKVEKQLTDEMNKNQETVGKMLFPLFRQNVPSEWLKFFSGRPSDSDLRKLLSEESNNAFEAPADHLQKMSCSIIFKGITYELLNDKQFIESARKHIKGSVRLHDEYEAARERPS